MDENNEKHEGKTLVFNPGGFVLKLIFSVVVTVLLMENVVADSDGSIGFKIFSCGFYFVTLWFTASMFGFCLRATGNYLIAAILFVILVAAMFAGYQMLYEKSKVAGAVAGIVFIAVLIWLPINDV
ncbi:MAG: hypothetical protein NC085_04760, partial [Muribaculaceae bacterium]|nr:hypothetical protein [Muribaculaceae bacterium]